MCCVELHCHADGSHLMPDVHVCSCEQPLAVITSGLIRHSHWLLCPKAWIWCGWLLCIPEKRCHNFSSGLTDFKLFASHRIWVLPLYFSLYCLRSEMVHPCLTACHCGFQELMSFFKPLKMWNSYLKMLIFLCSSIRNLDNFSAVDRFQIVTHLLYKISSSTCAPFTSPLM